MRLRTWAATSTSVARRSSVCARNLSPITCFHRPMAASALARFVYPDALCQAPRPWSAICWRWRSRCVGALSAVSLRTAVARRGTTTHATARPPGEGGRGGRDNTGRLGVALGDADINTILIERTFACKEGPRPRHLVE